MPQKNISSDKKAIKHKGYVLIIITILIMIPLIYLVFRNSTMLNTGGKVELVAGVDTNTTGASEQGVKLQNAISLASSQPNETNYINLSLEYYNNARYLDCASAAQNALQYNPNSYVAYNNLCSAYNQLGQWDDAIAAGKKALEIKPGDQLATNNLNVALAGKEKK